MIQTEVVDRALNLNDLLANFNDPEHGAQIIFTGVVRGHNQGKKVLGVSYDAHPVLADKVFRKICDEAKDKFGQDISIRVAHRTGRLDVGEVSLIILVSSRHRDESFKVSRYMIEEIKVRAPIWKKEHYIDGDSQWLQGHALCGHIEEGHGVNT